MTVNCNIFYASSINCSLCPALAVGTLGMEEGASTSGDEKWRGSIDIGQDFLFLYV
jgi:hypothetical protein